MAKPNENMTLEQCASMLEYTANEGIDKMTLTGRQNWFLAHACYNDIMTVVKNLRRMAKEQADEVSAEIESI